MVFCFANQDLSLKGAGAAHARQRAIERMCVMNLKAEEFYQFAIKIETEGREFYERLADRFPGEMATLFRDLAAQEGEHQHLFEKMAKSINRYTPSEFFSDEYFSYLHALTESDIFHKDRVKEEITELHDALGAVDFAIRRECESIFYYDALAILVNPTDMHLLESVIDEERGHVAQLEAIKNNIESKRREP